MLSYYQITNIVFGVVLFPFFYFIYLYFKGGDIIYWDIIWLTISIACILFIKEFMISYNIMKNQNNNLE